MEEGRVRGEKGGGEGEGRVKEGRKEKERGRTNLSLIILNGEE